MNTQTDNPYLKAVERHCGRMLEVGTGTAADKAFTGRGRPIPLFAAVVNAARMAPHYQQPQLPPGIRPGDLSWAGSNMLHDIPFLETLRALTDIGGDGRYAAAADAAIGFFAANGAHPATGLLAWGEHACWCFLSFKPRANYINPADPDFILHDHLRFVPEWFWRGMWRHNRRAVSDFARGLDGHIIDPDTFLFNRHASLHALTPVKERRGSGSHPRHAGFYVFDALMAFVLSGERDLLAWAMRLLDREMASRMPDGLVSRALSQGVPQSAPDQHLRMTLSVHDAAGLLPADMPEKRKLEKAAKDLFGAYLEHVRAGVSAPRSPESREVRAWGWGYGKKGGGSEWVRPLLHKQAHVRFPDELFGNSVLDGARRMALAAPPPERFPTLAWDFWGNLDLQLEAFALSGEPCFLENARRFADLALRGLEYDGLIRGAANMHLLIGNYYARPEDLPGFYYSGTGTPSLLRGLLRLAAILEGRADPLDTDDHFR